MKGSENITRPTKPESYDLKNLAFIAEVYGLPGLHFVSTPTNGIITENAILEDDNGKRYFVKLYNAEENDKYASTYRAAEVVAKNPNIPVSLPIKTSENSFTSTINGKSLALFEYIEHSELPPADEQAELTLATSMAKNLGLIHATPVSSDNEILRPIERWQPNQTERRRQVLIDIIGIIHNKPELNDFDTLALEVATNKLKLLEKLKPTQDEKPEMSICHGDYHAHNVLRNEDMKVVAICDWDNAGLSNKYVDLLNTFIMHIIGRRFDSYKTDRLEIAKSFIASYVEGNGENIDIEKLEAAYHTLMNERIGTTWPMNQHYLQGNTNQDGRLKIISEKSITLSENYDDIWDFILTAVNTSRKN